MGAASVAYERDLHRLMGPSGSAWLEHAQITAWQPNANLKPVSYFVQRAVDEAGFRRLADESGLRVTASTTFEDATWRLPDDLRFPGWAAGDIPPGGGFDAHGVIGNAMVFARWYGGNSWIVVTPSP